MLKYYTIVEVMLQREVSLVMNVMIECVVCSICKINNEYILLR